MNALAVCSSSCRRTISTESSLDDSHLIFTLDPSVVDDAGAGIWVARMFQMLAESLPKRQHERRPRNIKRP